MNDVTTIQEAVVLFTSLKGSSIKETEGGTETTYSVQARPLDLLAVCVRATAQANSSHVWIADSSLDQHQQILVSWFGNRGVSAIQEREIRVGSVVRFHGVLLKRKLQRGELITFEFWHSWEHQVGPEWSVLGHVTCGTHPQGPILNREPNPRQIQKLMAWYRQSSFYQEHLSPVPCQQWSLEKVQMSLGVVSNVMVHVTNISLVANSQGTKKRRLSPIKHSVVVTVSDGRHTVMPLVLTQGHGFQKTLDMALQQGHPVMLHHVVCRKADATSRNNEVVLMPTATTTMVMLPQETGGMGPSDENMTTEQTQEPFYYTCTPHSHHATLTMTTATQDAQSQRRRPSPVVIMEASLVAMKLSHASWGRDPPHTAVPPADELLSILTTNSNHGQEDYHDAILRIRCNHDMASFFCPSNNNIEETRVHANAAAMRHLCGGLDMKELKQYPLLLLHAREWLRGILEEPMLLRWRLVPAPDEQDWDYELDKVTLVKL